MTGGYFSNGKLRIYNTIIYGNNNNGSSKWDIQIEGSGSNVVDTYIGYCLVDKINVNNTSSGTVEQTNLIRDSNSQFVDF